MRNFLAIVLEICDEKSQPNVLANNLADLNFDDDDHHTGTLSQEYSAHVLHVRVVPGQPHLRLVQQPVFQHHSSAVCCL